MSLIQWVNDVELLIKNAKLLSSRITPQLQLDLDKMQACSIDIELLPKSAHTLFLEIPEWTSETKIICDSRNDILNDSSHNDRPSCS